MVKSLNLGRRTSQPIGSTQLGPTPFAMKKARPIRLYGKTKRK
jgi:hypothetical protein